MDIMTTTPFALAAKIVTLAMLLLLPLVNSDTNVIYTGVTDPWGRALIAIVLTVAAATWNTTLAVLVAILAVSVACHAPAYVREAPVIIVSPHPSEGDKPWTDVTF